MKERKRCECLGIGLAQVHGVRARALSPRSHLPKREEKSCVYQGAFSCWEGWSPRDADGTLDLVAQEESWGHSKVSLMGQ